MSVSSEFKKFVLRGNVVDLAVGVVIGGAFGKIVAAFVDDLVMPMVAPLLPGGNWREATITPLNFKIGHLFGTVLDFLIVAAVIFFVLVKFVGFISRSKEAEPAPPATKTCGECLETVPLAAKRCKFCTSALAVLALVLFGAPAFAQTTPKFEYVKPVIEAKPAAEWTAQVKGGLISAAGNSQATNFNLGAAASRKAGDNKFALDFAGAYGETKNRAFVPATAGSPTTVDSDADITRTKVVSTNNLLTKARYDRFLTENNAAYVAAALGRDKIAGKKVFGGGQGGYSRQLLSNEQHLVVGEFGYDFSYESYYGDADSVSIHSARVFVGETWKLSDVTGIYGNVEALFNVNKEGSALNASKKAPTGEAATGVGAFKDTRVNAKAGLTTTLWKNLSFGFGFTLKYDQNPAALSLPKPATPDPMALPYTAFAEKVDVITEASLIVTLL
ncbi:MAG: large conductance mechanosensitive channel protein MscL [Deltaproteobacteria bacterium]|nr:large conductance mechanosensitive channel protein MscL [Deltaproteobacteria bacterium]